MPMNILSGNCENPELQEKGKGNCHRSDSQYTILTFDSMFSPILKYKVTTQIILLCTLEMIKILSELM